MLVPTRCPKLMMKSKYSLLEERTEVLSKKTAAREVLNHEVQASIRYSRLIQGKIMSGDHALCKFFPESFLIDKPKDIVSGDFFWIKEKDNKIIVVVADCTGHGVPGAFMSILGISLLNQIVAEDGITNPALILEKLSQKINQTFSFGNDVIMQNDGMDIAVCCIDRDAGCLSFSGALRPAYIASGNELIILKGSRHAITEPGATYEAEIYQYKPGDKLYLFTDGYADQFGGPNNKKLLTKALKKILVEMSHFSMATQMIKMERIHSEWKAGMEQTDDILMLGIAL